MSWNVHYDQIMHRRDVGRRLLSERLKKVILEEIRVRADAPHNSPLQRQQGNWSRNASRSCFWDRYQGPRRSAIGQFFSSPRSLCERQVNSAQFPSRRITAGCNSQSGSDSKQRLSFHLALSRLFYFFPNMLIMPRATTSVMRPSKTYTNQKSVLYIILENKQ